MLFTSEEHLMLLESEPEPVSESGSDLELVLVFELGLALLHSRGRQLLFEEEHLSSHSVSGP
jgi:hypothetical protein